MIRNYLVFLGRAHRLSLSGSRLYYSWMALLALLALIGARTFFQQLAGGLGATGMSDQVSWGVYNASLTYYVGLAVSAVLLVIPAYIYRNKEMYDAVLIGGLLAVSAIVACLLFVAVDVGRPDRFWHVIPFIGTPNFPSSMLAWDVIVLTGYLIVTLYLSSYLLYVKYLGREPVFLLYGPFIALSIVWAVSIHLITVFLYVGLIGRPFWNAAVVAPRFLGSAFTAGPGILIIAFLCIRRYAHYQVSQKAIDILRYIVTASLLLNIFLLSCETFKEFYAAHSPSSSTRYLFLGLEYLGQYQGQLVPWIWTAVVLQFVAAAILCIGPVAHRSSYLITACVFANVGIWIEKGMGMVVPGFVPSPQGTVVGYSPSWSEMFVSLGIFAFGLLLFSFMLHVAVPIIDGDFHVSGQEGRLRHEGHLGGERRHPAAT